MDARPDVNQWLWRFARGKPRLGGLSVEDTDDIGGQTRADFFKSLRESAKSAFGALFADFF